MKEIFAWVPWFEELAKKIAEGGESQLVAKAKEIRWKDDGTTHPLLKYGEENIDPFSFLFSLASCASSVKSTQLVFPEVHKAFQLSASLPPLDVKDAWIFPMPTFKALFHADGNGNPELLWRLFRSTVSGRSQVSGQDFENAQQIKEVKAAKLTQSMFLINAKEFFPFDSTYYRLIKGGKSPATISWVDYCKDLDSLQRRFPGCGLYEVNILAYLTGKSKEPLVVNRSPIWQISSLADGVKDFWAQFVEDNGVFTFGTGEVSWAEYNPDVHEIKYPLNQPKQGDIVLIRRGHLGRGIGIVYRNDYLESYTHDSRIHVLWIAKTNRALSTGVRKAFSRAHRLAFGFREAYQESFELLDSIAQDEPNPDSFEGLNSNAEVHPPTQKRKLNTILYGPPGTGKTYQTMSRSVEICDGDVLKGDGLRYRYHELIEQGRIDFITFHQSYSYEEFVEGLRPTVGEDGQIGYETRDGVLKRLAERATDDLESEQYVLVIDEINRANISKVLGELITLLEEDKREGAENHLTVKLPYSQESFSLPSNLHVLGTMNTADRSIALLDTALRRRFNFFEVAPNPGLLEDAHNLTGVDLPKVLAVMNERLEYLVDRDHMIGHAWLMSAKNREQLDEIMRNKIIPVLSEYFYDDWNKVRAVLGGTDAFVESKRLAAPPGLEPEEEEERYRWMVQEQFPDSAYDELINGNRSQADEA